MTFWIVVALLACIATATVLWPLIGARIAPEDAEAADRERRLAIYRDRREEIDRERTAGRLTADEAESAQRELLDDVAESFDEAPGGTPSRAGDAARRPLAAIVVAIALPAIALLVYQRVGSPELEAVQAQDAEQQRQLAQVEAAIRELETRTREHPDDGEAWAMLGGARKLVGDPQNAIPAFEKALALLGPHPRLLADLAESIAITQGGRFAGRPTELLEKALAADPLDAKINGLMGAAMFQAGNLVRARQHLAVLLKEMPADSPQAAQIRSVIAKIDEKTGGPPPDAASAPAGPAPVLVAGTVDIDPALQAKVPPNATVFVNARAPSGPRMPFAASRLPASAVPGRFELSDAQSMIAQRKLSGAAEVVVEVRISASGQAGRASGDLYGVSAPVHPGSDAARSLVVHIDRVVP